MSSDVSSILGPGGRIAARLSTYETRPEQLEMAEAVAAASPGTRLGDTVKQRKLVA